MSSWSPQDPGEVAWSPEDPGAVAWDINSPATQGWSPAVALETPWTPAGAGDSPWEVCVAVCAKDDATITGLWTFDRDPGAPFVVTPGSAYVANLDADKLDGEHGSYYSDYDNLTNVPASFTPSAHKTSHQNGGADEISVVGLSGLLADGQTPLAHNQAAGTINSGTFDNARIAQSNVTQHVGAIDHNALLNYAVGQHRTINDAGSGGTDLWSASKIGTALGDYLPLAGGTMSGDIAMGGKGITGLDRLTFNESASSYLDSSSTILTISAANVISLGAGGASIGVNSTGLTMQGNSITNLGTTGSVQFDASNLISQAVTGTIDYTAATLHNFVGPVTSNGAITGANLYVPDGGAVGISGAELITFNAAGTIAFSGADVTMSGTLGVTGTVTASDIYVPTTGEVGMVGKGRFVFTDAAQDRIQVTGAFFGIGVAATRALTVAGKALISGDGLTSSGGIELSDEGTYSRIQSYGGEPLAINTLGNNVLVATTTDAGYKLDVAGTFRATLAATLDTSLTMTTTAPINFTDANKYINFSTNMNYVTDSGNHAFAGGNVTLLTDSQAVIWGGGSDMDMGYTGVYGYIRTDLIAASDLQVDCGTAKTPVLVVPVWEDIQFHMSTGALRGANQPTWSTFTTNTMSYQFAVDDVIDLESQELNHKWKEGGTGNFHLHLALDAASAGATRYAKFEIYVAYANAETGVFAESTLTAELTIPASSSALKEFYLDMGDVTFTNRLIGTQVVVTFKRIAATTGTDYADEIFALQCGCHIEQETLGSRQEVVK